MKILRDLCVCLALLALPAFALWLAMRLDNTIDGIDLMLASVTVDLRTVGQAVAEVPSLLDQRIADATVLMAAIADGQLSGARRDIRTLGDKLDAPLLAVSGAVENLSGIRQDLVPLLHEAEQTAAIATLTMKDLRPQMLGLVAASKIAAGEVATMGREAQRAMPEALVTWNRIGANVEATTSASARASAETAKTMQNLAKATAPLPRWIRIPLSITGAIGPTAAAGLAGAAATGAFR